MALLKRLLPETFPADTSIPVNTVVVASTVNAGNAMLPAAAGAQNILGVMINGTDQSGTSPANYYGTVELAGIVPCRSLTGTAIAVGDKVKIGDTAGRVTKFTDRAALSVVSGTLKGVLGVAMSAVASGDASDTIIYVLLTPGATGIE